MNELEAAPPPEILSALGHHLASLPVDVRIGKLIILGVLLQCADPALTLAAALSMRSPFVAPCTSNAPNLSARDPGPALLLTAAPTDV